MRFELIAPGAFPPSYSLPGIPSGTPTTSPSHYGEYLRPFRVHYGYVADGSDDWDAVGDINITYDAAGANHPVTIQVPDSQTRKRFAYVIWFGSDKGDPSGYYTENRFVNLTRPEGDHICLPVLNYSPLKDGYLLDSFYRVLTWENLAEKPIEYPGKVRSIYYGFTDASRQQFLGDRNPPWRNSDGRYSYEGCIRAPHRFVGGQFGSSVMPFVWVRVPVGMNVVYRICLDKFRPDWFPVEYEGYAETQVYYMQLE
jgi:hypothetical protein